MSYFPSVAFLTGSVGSGEWLVLFVVILLVIGPRRMPEVARKIGRMMEMFRRAADEFKDQLMTMDQAPTTTSTPDTPALTSADADGVPSSGADDGASGEPYDDAYANLSAYPGNEDQVENWSADALPDAPAPDAPAPDAPAAAPEAEKQPETGT